MGAVDAERGTGNGGFAAKGAEGGAGVRQEHAVRVFCVSVITVLGRGFAAGL